MKRTFRIAGIALVLMAILVLSPVFISEGIAAEGDTITVTLKSDGTEHDYITTSDPELWTDGTLYESEYASNQQTYQVGSYWVVEYDLDNVRIYEDSAGTTWLSYDKNTDTWTYNDDLNDFVDSYTLVLPDDAQWVSSDPAYDSSSGNTLVWYNTDYQHTTFKSGTYNEVYSVDSGVSGALILGVIMLIAIAGLLAFLFLKKKKGGAAQQYQAQPGPYGPYAGSTQYDRTYQNSGQAQYGGAQYQPDQSNQQVPYGGAAYVQQGDQNAPPQYPQQGNQQPPYGGAAYVPQNDQTVPFSPTGEEENQ